MTHDRLAASIGVWAGMPVAEAKTLTLDHRGRSEPCFLPCDPAGDVDALRRLAWACDRFTPIICLEQTDVPESLLLDITGCGPLFDGEEHLAAQLHQQVGGYGLHTRLAIADTLGAAWALAHGGTRTQPIVIVTGDEMRDRLRSLPVTALRLPNRIITQLHEFQLRQIDQLLALPRSSLPSRFGDILLQRIDQAFGTRTEAIIPEPRPEPIKATWESEIPLQSSVALEAVINELLETVLNRLQQRGEGVSRLNVRLKPVEGDSQTLCIECVRPTTEQTHLLDLLQLQWERESFPQGLCRVQLTVLQAGRLTLSPSTLWPTDDDGGNDEELLRLMERLISRLGADAVLRPKLVPDAQPERSYVYEPVISDRDFRDAEKPPRSANETGLSRLTRPVWLFPSPVSIEVLSIEGTGPPSWFRWQRDFHIARHWGPERITTGWWRGAYIRRDYYHVETTQSQRFWMFRDLRTRHWFLHAICD